MREILEKGCEDFVMIKKSERRIGNPYSRFVKLKNRERRIGNPYSRFVKLKNLERGYDYEK